MLRELLHGIGRRKGWWFGEDHVSWENADAVQWPFSDVQQVIMVGIVNGWELFKPQFERDLREIFDKKSLVITYEQD